MLDEGKVHADANASSQKRLDGRVAKFFALACGHGVAKGCVNYGVMQVRACMRQVRRESDASTMARRAVGGRRHIARQVAPASCICSQRQHSLTTCSHARDNTFAI